MPCEKLRFLQLLFKELDLVHLNGNFDEFFVETPLTRFRRASGNDHLDGFELDVRFFLRRFVAERLLLCHAR